MATTKCSGCGGSRYEVKLFEPAGGNFKQNMVQCASCGVPVGVLDFYNIGAELQSRKTEIAQVRKLVEALGSSLLDEVRRLRAEVAQLRR